MDRARRLFMRHGAAACALPGLLPGLLGGRVARAEPLVDALRIVVGFPAGGSADLIGRSVAEALRGAHARVTLVDNKAGAGGQLAIAALKAMPADGSALLLTPSSMVTLFPHTYRQLPYDPQHDLLPVSLACRFDLAFAVGPMVDLSVRSLADFAAWARSHPGAASVGSPASGSSTHFIGELFGRAVKVPLNHVPYRGGQPAVQDLAGGQIASVCAPLGEFLPQLPGGRIRLLAVCGATRSRFVPEVPTFAEQGLAELAAEGWYAFYLPAGASAEVVQATQAALRAALARPQVVAEFARMGLEAASSSADELASLQQRESARWRAIVREVGFAAM